MVWYGVFMCFHYKVSVRDVMTKTYRYKNQEIFLYLKLKICFATKKKNTDTLYNKQMGSYIR